MEKDIDIKKIKLITFVAISIVFLIVGTVKISNDFNYIKQIEKDKELLNFNQANFLYKQEIKRLKQDLTNRVRYLANDNLTKKALLTKNKKYINNFANIAKQRYNIMKKAYKTMANLKLIDKDGKVIFAIKDYYKNRVPKIVKKSIKDKKEYVGLADNFLADSKLMYRISVPIFDKNSIFLGVLVTGVLFDYVLDNITTTISNINKEKVIVIPFLKDKKNIDKNKYIIFKNYITPKRYNIQDILKNFNGDYHISFNDKIYHLSFDKIKLFDYENQSIGNIAYFIDETKYIKKLKQEKIKAFALPLIAITILMVVFNIAYNYFYKKINDSYRYIKKILDSQPTMVIIGYNKKIVTTNRFFLDFFGYKKLEDFTKQYNCICDLFLSQDNKNYLQKEVNGVYWADYIMSNQNKTHKVLLKDKNRKLHVFEIKGGYFDKDRLIFTFADITELEQEKEKMRIKDKLLLEQSKLASMGEMIGNIAHQWRQPLSIISTTATGIELQNELGTLDISKLGELCNTINNNAQYLSKTIDDFRNFIKNDIKKESFNIVPIIEKTINLINASFKDNNIKLIKKIDIDGAVIGVPNEAIQALINILNNAKDVLKEKNKDDNRVVLIQTCIKNNKFIIKIHDNGGGIKDNIISHIFEPYFTTKHKSQGTGLGLYMTYQIFTGHFGGKIYVNNRYFEIENNRYFGAEFTIKLPLKSEDK